MRSLRLILNHGLPILGMVLIVGALFVCRSIYSQLTLVLVGILCIEAGVYQLAHRVLPGDRRFHDLRRELDAFVDRCRHLSQAALAIKVEDTPEHRATFDDIHRALHQSVEVIVEVAGQAQDDLSHEPREKIALG